jgi:hypothetical protein
MSTTAVTAPSIVPSNRIIVSDALRHHVCQVMYTLVGASRVQDHVPLPHPVSLERSTLHRLLSSDGSASGSETPQYVVGEKSNGVRYVLLLMMHPSDNEPVALMIDRFFRMFPVSVYASKSFFERGSLFDGELVVSTSGTTGGAGAGAAGVSSLRSKLVYLVFDVMALRGECMMRKVYTYRRQCMQRVFEVGALYDNADDAGTDTVTATNGSYASAATNGSYASAATNGSYDLEARQISRAHNSIVSGLRSLEFQPKPFYQLSQIDIVLRQLIARNSDGLVFMPLTLPITLGRESNIYKLKFTHTVDLRYKGGYLDAPSTMRRQELSRPYDWFFLRSGGTTPSECSLDQFEGDLGPWEFQIDHAFDGDISLACNSVWELEIIEVDGHCSPSGRKSAHLRIVRERNDKDTPNDAITLSRTLNNFVEAITTDELVRFLGARA